MRYSALKTDRTSQWVETLKKRVGINKATVALANKNARIIWAMLVHNREYKAPIAA
jgi:transposase